ncbi:MAG: DUF424 family protein [Halobacteria archaeon]
MCAKIYRQEGHVVVAACDRELLGRTLREGNVRLEVSEAFYEGESVTREELRAALAGATTANLVGEEAVACAREGGFVEESGVVWIEGVPHAQFFRV